MAVRNSELASRRRLPRYAWAALIILLTAAVTWLFAHEGHQPLPTKGVQVDVARGKLVISREAREALDVKTEEVREGRVEEKLLAYATLVAPWEQYAFVTARLPGRIASLNVKPGESVMAGQVLAEVESLELKTLQLELLNAKNEVELSTKVLNELNLATRDAALPGQRERDVQSNHQKNLNAFEIARSKALSIGLNQAQLDQLILDRGTQVVPSLPIRSPIAGIVDHTDLAVGKYVAATEHLFEIVNLATVWVKIGVLEQDLNRVVLGQSVELTLAAHPGEILAATVKVKDSYLDPVTHVGTVWADFANPPGREPRFRPGMNGEAQIALPTSAPMLTIPAKALIVDGAERYVLVEETATAGGSQFQKKNVVVGRRKADIVEIHPGDVFPGDRVVTRGSHELGGFFFQGVLRPGTAAAKNIGLAVEPVSQHVIEETVELDGAVEIPPDRRSFASSHVAGTLHRLYIGRGQAVQAGDVIAEVASLDVQNMQLELLKAHLDSTLLDASIQSMRDAPRSFPGRQMWELETARNAATNRKDSLIQKLLAIGLSREQIDTILSERKLIEAMPLRAPVSGTVVHFDKVLGQAVKSEEPLFEIHDVSRVWIRAHVPESDVAKIRLGQKVRVRLMADSNFLAEGQIVRSGHILGMESRTLSAWIEMDLSANTPLSHNMLARITVTTGQTTPALAVPILAVVYEGIRPYVFVRKSDATFERRAIETGRTDDRFIEIIAGLNLGEEIAVRGAAELQTAYAALR